MEGIQGHTFTQNNGVRRQRNECSLGGRSPSSNPQLLHSLLNCRTVFIRIRCYTKSIISFGLHCFNCNSFDRIKLLFSCSDGTDISSDNLTWGKRKLTVSNYVRVTIRWHHVQFLCYTFTDVADDGAIKDQHC